MHIHSLTQLHTHTHTHTQIYSHTHTQSNTRAHRQSNTRTHNNYKHTHTHTHTTTHTNQKHAHTDNQIHAHTPTANTHTHTHTHLHMFTHFNAHRSRAPAQTLCHPPFPTLPLSSFALCAACPSSHRHKLSPDTPNTWQDAHTPFHDIVATPRPRSLLSLKLVDLDSIAFQIEYPISKSAAWIFLYSDKLCRIYIFPWFAIFGGTRHCCLQLYLLFLCHH